MAKSNLAKLNRFDLAALDPQLDRLASELRAGISCSVFGVQNSMRAAISASLDKKILYLSSSDVLANSAVSSFELMGLKTVKFGAILDEFLYKKVQSSESYLARLEALSNILSGNFDVVVAEISALFSFLPSPKEFLNHVIKLKAGQTIEIEKLEKLLVDSGYRKDEIISDAGEFSRRGEVLDVFPLGAKYPFRIDFFDTEIETIKVFDIVTQKATKPVENLTINPFCDMFLSSDKIELLRYELLKLKKKSEKTEDSIFASQIQDLLVRLEHGEGGFSQNVLSPYLDDFRSTIFDYFAAAKTDTLVVIDECKGVFDALLNFEKESSDRISELRKSGTLIAGKREVYFSKEKVISEIQKQTSLAFLKITNQNNFFKSQAVFNLKTIPLPKYLHNKKEFASDIRQFLAAEYKVLIFSGSADQAEAARNILSSYGVSLEISKTFDGNIKSSAIYESGYESGFVLPNSKIVVVGTYDLFAKKRSEKSFAAGKQHAFSVPKVGDYVVHQVHGIGICEGITTLSGTLGTKDYVVIGYRDGDKLYVPTTQMDLLDKFSGAETPKKLSKIGGQEFAAVKAKVKESVKKLAFSLVELYATREKIKGFAFSEDNELMHEFENAFAYTETEDQLASISEIKKDMESQKVMDRLVCGDVGFGKTEVAMRAMFKAVMDGKQVAFIAPTTILSEQHYNTLRARMMDFGIEASVLNRFKTKKQVDEILNKLQLGKIDILCGTHRILSDDVNFASLGLIVLDEEQKFGVEDKEKLKNKYPFVDVLTLSATPIPRTLNMALSGIRDISIIATPPSERLPIQTYVVEYNEPMVRDAINRELARGGQVFILFNSVEKIYSYAEKVRKLVPEAKILVAHGQMGAKEMEQVIYDFYHKKGDILICTTIIENGIDIENANTLIVYDADKLGLSQLYQIRGRVGRGYKMAFAYFTYEYNKVLTEEAYKRLDAMSEFCEFGSGFKLAMRDLEIRGGGNILGAEQSGHLQRVGYDLYAKLLSEAVQELSGKTQKESEDVLVKVALDAYVPDTFVATSEERMVVYKRISTISSIEEVEKVKLELKEAYGEIPRVVENLIKISLARQLAKKLCASEIISFGAEVSLVFDDKSKITDSEVLGESIYKFRMACSLDFADKPKIKFDNQPLASQNFEELLKFLLTSQKISEKFNDKNKN